LQLTCPPDWNALADIDGPSADRVILGLKAREWRKEHLDMLLAKTKECQASSGSPESVRKAELMDIQTRAYPSAVAAIDHRDQRLQQESQRVQQVAQSSAAQVPAEGAVAVTAHQPSERELDKQRRDAEFAQQVSRNAELDAQRQSDRSRNEKLSIGGALLAIISAAWSWNQFVRNRCPQCRSTDFDTTNVAETDRWRGTKKVSTVAHRPGGIKGQSYKDVTKHVATTYVKKLHEYRCRTCQNEWTRETKEEL
jgi:transposase-like protein